MVWWAKRVEMEWIIIWYSNRPPTHRRPLCVDGLLDPWTHYLFHLWAPQSLSWPSLDRIFSQTWLFSVILGLPRSSLTLPRRIFRRFPIEFCEILGCRLVRYQSFCLKTHFSEKSSKHCPCQQKSRFCLPRIFRKGQKTTIQNSIKT